MNSDNVKYFDSFEVEHIPKEIKSIIDNISEQTFIEYNHTINCIGLNVVD